MPLTRHFHGSYFSPFTSFTASELILCPFFVMEGSRKVTFQFQAEEKKLCLRGIRDCSPTGLTRLGSWPRSHKAGPKLVLSLTSLVIKRGQRIIMCVWVSGLTGGLTLNSTCFQAIYAEMIRPSHVNIFQMI